MTKIHGLGVEVRELRERLRKSCYANRWKRIYKDIVWVFRVG